MISRASAPPLARRRKCERLRSKMILVRCVGHWLGMDDGATPSWPACGHSAQRSAKRGLARAHEQPKGIFAECCSQRPGWRRPVGVMLGGVWPRHCSALACQRHGCAACCGGTGAFWGALGGRRCVLASRMADPPCLALGHPMERHQASAGDLALAAPGVVGRKRPKCGTSPPGDARSCESFFCPTGL